MSIKEDKVIDKDKDVAYTKDQILASKKYSNRKDVLNVVLKNGKLYTLKQVDEQIEKFMKGKVK